MFGMAASFARVRGRICVYSSGPYVVSILGMTLGIPLDTAGSNVVFKE